MKHCFSSLRRSTLLLLLCCLCAVKAGAQTKTVVRSNVRVLPTAGLAGRSSNGTMSVVGQSASSLTMRGQVPTLKRGDVLVSAQGAGSLRKVVEVKRKDRETVVVQTAPAQLTDVFDQADIRLKKRLGAADFANIRTASPAIRVASQKMVRAYGPPTSSGIAPKSTINANLSFNFVDYKLETPGATAQAAVSLNGSLNLGASIDVGLSIRRQGLTPVVTHSHALFTISPGASISLKGELSASVSKKFPIATIPGQPIVVTVGVVPVVFVPLMEVYGVFDGTLKVGAETTFAVTSSVTAGVNYDEGSGYSLVKNFNNAVGFENNFSASLAFSYTPARCEFSLLTYGVAGPYVAAESPKLSLTATRSATQTCITAQAIYSGEAGAKFRVLGLNEDWAQSFSQEYIFYDGCTSVTGATPTPRPTTVPANAVARLEIAPASPSVNAGTSVRLSAAAFDAANTPVPVSNADLRWSSSNASIAAVNVQGIAQALQAGSVTITVTHPKSGKSANVTLVVGASRATVTNTASEGVGSLQEALEYANVFPGTTIKFNIPTSDAGFENGVFTIATTTLPAIASDVTIDGTSQTSFTGNTNATGPEVVLDGPLQIKEDTTTLKGLIFIWSDGSVDGTLNIQSGATCRWRYGTLLGTLNIASGAFLDVPPDLIAPSGYPGAYRKYVYGTLNNAGIATVGDVSGGQAVIRGRDDSPSTINNSGTWTMKGNAYLGDYNNVGVLNNTGTLNNVGYSYLYFRCNNTGTVQVQQGIIYFGSTAIQTAGQTLLNGGDIRGPLDISGGIVSGVGTINGDVTNFGGTIGTGSSIGTLNITGKYLQGAGGAMNVKIGGRAAGEFDRILIGGAATLDGTLNADLVNGFAPNLGESFPVLKYGSHSGSFATLNSGQFAPDYQSDGMSLRIGAAPALSLSAPQSSVNEGGSLTATVARNTPTTSALRVSLSSSDVNAATVPVEVTIPAGQSSATFSISAVENALAEGNKSVSIAATASGLAAASATVTVIDNDVAALGLSLAPTTFSEAAGPNAATGTVTRNTPTTAALVVALSSSNVAAATVPATITIPAGRASATFAVSATDNLIVDGTRTSIITARVTDFASAATTVTVTDNDVTPTPVPPTPTPVPPTPTPVPPTPVPPTPTPTPPTPEPPAPAPDRIAPTANFTTPKHGDILNALPLLRGQMSDNEGGSGMAGVEVTIMRFDGKTWSGNSWEAGIQRVPGLTSGNNWGFNNVPRGANLADGPYRMAVWPIDKAGNKGITVISFRIDATPPRLLWAAPTTNATLGATPLQFAVRAQDSSGVGGVDVSIQRAKDGGYWNGRGWQRAPAALATVYSGAYWVLRIGAPPQSAMEEGVYQLSATATDRAGNKALARQTLTLRSGSDGTGGPTTASSVRLSRAAARVADNAIDLFFTEPLQIASLRDEAEFAVRVNGVDVEIVDKAYAAADNRLSLKLKAGVLAAGARVEVSWSGIRDARGAPLAAGHGAFTVGP